MDNRKQHFDEAFSHWNLELTEDVHREREYREHDQQVMKLLNEKGFGNHWK